MYYVLQIIYRPIYTVYMLIHIVSMPTRIIYMLIHIIYIPIHNMNRNIYIMNGTNHLSNTIPYFEKCHKIIKLRS